MLRAIIETSVAFKIIKTWRDDLSGGTFLLREIINLDAIYNSDFNMVDKEESEVEDVRDCVNDEEKGNDEKGNESEDISSANLNISVLEMESDLLPKVITALDEIIALTNEALVLKKILKISLMS